jgi:glyoxylase-like metal-dependent hydrolase (beta-lactamase superfamily II)
VSRVADDGVAAVAEGFAARPAARGAAEAEVEIKVGRYSLLAISDGFFEVGADFLGTPEHPTGGHDALKDEHDEVAVPLGCFLMPGEAPTLIDLGLGPHQREGWEIALSGGRLPARLAAAGYAPEDIRTIALSHLHLDHTGWLCDREGEPTFANADVYVATADWDYFMDGEPNMPLDPAVRRALVTLVELDRVILLDDDRQIVPGLTRLAAPGHTPGHSLFVVHDGSERALLLGDAMACPAQMTATDWSLASDVDRRVAQATRERFIAEMDANGGVAVGCHFPELRAGRILAGDWVQA